MSSCHTHINLCVYCLLQLSLWDLYLAEVDVRYLLLFHYFPTERTLNLIFNHLIAMIATSPRRRFVSGLWRWQRCCTRSRSWGGTTLPSRCVISRTYTWTLYKCDWCWPIWRGVWPKGWYRTTTTTTTTPTTVLPPLRPIRMYVSR